MCPWLSLATSITHSILQRPSCPHCVTVMPPIPPQPFTPRPQSLVTASPLEAQLVGTAQPVLPAPVGARGRLAPWDCFLPPLDVPEEHSLPPVLRGQQEEAAECEECGGLGSLTNRCGGGRRAAR